MAHIFGEIWNRSRQKVRIAGEIYHDVPSAIKNVIWIGLGALSGYCYALYNSNQLKIPFSEPIPESMKDEKVYLVSHYKVDPLKVDLFEKEWNRLARRTQKSDGYFYTQLYKHSTPGKQPSNYLQLVLWRNPKTYSYWLDDQDNKPIMKILRDNCLETNTLEYTTLFDDSIVRMIPP